VGGELRFNDYARVDTRSARVWIKFDSILASAFITLVQRMSNRPLNVEIGDYGVFDAVAFFEALAISKEMAIEMLRRQVPGDGIVPSPRAQEVLDSGEWDAVEAVSLKRLSQSGTCVGIVGSIGASTTRFCGKTLDTCAARRHVTEVWEGYSGGWYIQAGSRSSSGFYQDPHLPLEEDGGPINRDIEEVLEDSADPFVLSAGQWKFVCEEWLASRVDTFSQLSDLEREATRQADRDDANPGTPRPIDEEDGDDDPVGIPGFA
jgi:hypothetical protein